MFCSVFAIKTSSFGVAVYLPHFLTSEVNLMLTVYDSHCHFVLPQDQKGFIDIIRSQIPNKTLLVSDVQSIH